MTVSKGMTVWGARLYKGDTPDHWFPYTVADPVGKEGASAAVHMLEPADTNPPLVAKIFNGEIRDRIRADDAYANRILIPALYRDELLDHLEFAAWPRRVLFDVKQPAPHERREHLIGFTMERLIDTLPLEDLFTPGTARRKLTPEDTLYIAGTLAEQLAKMHRHRWGFVFGDMSPLNIHVTRDFKRVLFIDTDSFQFTVGKGRHHFTLYGLTPSFSSPGVRALIHTDQPSPVTPAHDDYVLAILIFMLMMADTGIPSHPFNSPEGDEDDLIDRRYFPFAQSPPRVAGSVFEAYQTLPQIFRDAFKTTFTGPTPIPAHEWAQLIANHRRSLWR